MYVSAATTHWRGRSLPVTDIRLNQNHVWNIPHSDADLIIANAGIEDGMEPPFMRAENIVLNKTTSVSGMYNSTTSGDKGTDDSLSTIWASGAVSTGNYAWWQVDLNDQYSITGIELVSRQDIDHAHMDKPFFLYLPLPSPHTPWLPIKEFKGKTTAGKYGDYVNMVDAMIGKVMETVNRLGIDENTLIIVTSDNGADWRPSDIEEHKHQPNHIYKGRKADIYEAGHRVPFIACWKGVIPEGHRSDEVMCTTDLLGTMAGLLKNQ